MITRDASEANYLDMRFNVLKSDVFREGKKYNVVFQLHIPDKARHIITRNRVFSICVCLWSVWTELAYARERRTDK